MIAAGLLDSRLNLDPGSWLAWIVVGLIAGAIAARVVAGRGFGCLADIVVGVAGAIIGGFLLSSLFGMTGNVGFFGSIVVAFIGAMYALTKTACAIASTCAATVGGMLAGRRAPVSPAPISNPFEETFVNAATN